MPLLALEEDQVLASKIAPRPADIILGWQQELDEYFTEMKELHGYEPDQVFMRLAGWSARASEIRSQLVRAEGRRAQAFRTREIEPFLDEIDRQFRLHSRVQSVREWDLKLQGKVF